MTAPMLSTVDVIKQIRDNTKYFKQVSGIGDINRMMNQQNIPATSMPFCGVYVPMTSATENQNMPGYFAFETVTYQCVVVLDMTQDDTGYRANNDAFDYARADLKKCLMGWDACPDRSNGYPMWFAGGQLVKGLDGSNSRAVYTFDFDITLAISEDDGYYPGYDTDLTEIDTTMPNNNSTTVLPIIKSPNA